MLELLELYNLTYPSSFIFGLIIGSFLNVVINRLPIMMEREWQAMCADQNVAEPPHSAAYNLMTPRSKCPSCGHMIKFYENIPIISYLFLKGRCASCKTHISLQYPFIELLTAILTSYIVYHFGTTVQAATALILTYSLIALSAIDIKEMILPDKITLPVLWLGLLLSLSNVFTTAADSIIGAAAGYLLLWSVFHIFKLVTGKEGMGYGDFKLLAMLGAWLGWQSLPSLIILSALSGSVIGILMIIFLKRDKQIPIPFGPYLAIAGLIYLFWGQEINLSYLQLLR